MMVSGHRLGATLDQMPGMAPFVDHDTAQPHLLIQEDEHIQLQQAREVYRLEPDGDKDNEWCSMLVDKDDNLAYRFSDGSIVLHDRSDDGAAHLQWNGDIDQLRYMLWLAYAHTALTFHAVPVHSSVVVCQGKAVLCLGESGTGKSTHTRLWINHIDGCHLLNDDSPIVRVEPDGVWAYGSPWSGKTPCFRQERVPIAAFLRLAQRPENSIRRLGIIESFAALHPSCPPTLAHDERCTDRIVEFIDGIITRVPVYRMGCLPDADAVRMSHDTIFNDLCK